MAFASGDNVGMAVQDLERRFIDLPQHFDTFISERSRMHPTVLTQRFPRGAYPYFQGLEQTINIFHGTVGEQAGLSNFKQMQLSSAASGDDPGNDACGPFTSKTFEHGFEARAFTGYEGVWESPVICLSDLMFLHQGREQAQLVAKQLPVVVESIWETWTREQVLSFSVMAGNGYILNNNGIQLTANGERFAYNPYAEKDYGNGPVPYVTFPADAEVGGLDLSFFDWIHDYLSDECPEAKLSEMGGVPVFGLVVHDRDIKNMIEDNDRLREAYLYGNPQQLIDGYPLTFRNLCNWAIIPDARQMRFVVEGYNDDGDIEARRVLPKRYVATTQGDRPEANPEYTSAEIAIGFVMINDSFSTLVPGNVPNLGSNMSFGPIAGLNGQFNWVNEYHETKNPNREKGNYRARFRMFPRPGDFSRNLISFLYSRTPHAYAGPQIRVADQITPVASSNLAADVQAGDFSADGQTLEITTEEPLAVVGIPQAVVVTGADTTTYDGVIIDSVDAPSYTVAFTADQSGEVANLTTATTIDIV